MPHSHVLLVDSDEDARIILRRLLEHEGYSIIEAIDHDSAVSALRANVVGVVVTELYVARGSETSCLLESLKADRALAGIPVVVVTTQAFDDDERRARTAGSAAYIVKPFAVRDVVAEIERLFPV